MSHSITNTTTVDNCLCEAFRRRKRAVLTANKEKGFNIAIPPPSLNVRLGCHYESELCPVAIKRKNETNGAIKDTGWLLEQEVAGLLHHLVTECVHEKIMLSFSVTRLGDFSTTLVFGKGETEKYYCSSVDELFLQVVEITGGSGDTEMYTNDGEVLAPTKAIEDTKKRARKA